MTAAEKKILLVDDDPAFLEINHLILESAGYWVAEAGSVEQALRLLQTDRFDLLVLDLIMESMDSGFTIAYAVRNDERLRDLPILLLTSAQERTGFTFEMERDQQWMKVDEVAAKPLRPTELIERVERLLAKAKREDHG